MATENFDFTLLAGTDTAGYTSINALINSIDGILEQRVFGADKSAITGGATSSPSADQVMVWSGTWGSAGGHWKASKIVAANIDSSAVTEAKINNGAVSVDKLASNSVTTVKIANDAVTADKLADNSVLTANIGNGQVTAAKLDANLTTQILPSGMIAPYAGDTAPSGWLLCNGAAVSRTTYNGLFSIIGTQYGVGDNSTTFNLPNLIGRTVIGLDASQAEFNVLGETGGVKEVTLTSAQSGIPAHGHTASSGGANANISIQGGGGHSHSINDPGHVHSYASLQYLGADVASGTARGRYGSPTGVNTGGSGTGISINGVGDHGHGVSQSNHSHAVTVNNNTAVNAASAHTNLSPYITLNYIIKI